MNTLKLVVANAFSRALKLPEKVPSNVMAMIEEIADIIAQAEHEGPLHAAKLARELAEDLRKHNSDIFFPHRGFPDMCEVAALLGRFRPAVVLALQPKQSLAA